MDTAKKCVPARAHRGVRKVPDRHGRHAAQPARASAASQDAVARFHRRQGATPKQKWKGLTDSMCRQSVQSQLWLLLEASGHLLAR